MITNWLLTYVVASFSVPLGLLIAKKTKSEWEGTSTLAIVSDTFILVTVGIALYVSLGFEPLSLYAALLGALVGYFAGVGLEFLPAASLTYYLNPTLGSYIPVGLSAFWLAKGPGLETRTMLFQWVLFATVSAVFVVSGLFVFASVMPFIISFFMGLSIGQLVKYVDT